MVLVQLPEVHTEHDFGCSILVYSYLIGDGIKSVCWACYFPYDVLIFPFLPNLLFREGGCV